MRHYAVQLYKLSMELPTGARGQKRLKERDKATPHLGGRPVIWLMGRNYSHTMECYLFSHQWNFFPITYAIFACKNSTGFCNIKLKLMEG